jgi:hypothetical protein
MAYYEPWTGYSIGKPREWGNWAKEITNILYGVPKFNASEARNVHIPTFQLNKREKGK